MPHFTLQPEGRGQRRASLLGHDILGSSKEQLSIDHSNVAEYREWIQKRVTAGAMVTIGNAGMGGKDPANSPNLIIKDSVKVIRGKITGKLRKMLWTPPLYTIKVNFLGKSYKVSHHENKLEPVKDGQGSGIVNIDAEIFEFVHPDMAANNQDQLIIYLSQTVKYHHAFAISQLEGNKVMLFNPHGRDHLYLEISDLHKYFNEVEASKIPN